MCGKKRDEYITKICKNEKVSVDELKGGSRRKEVSGVRSRIAPELVKGHGVALAEIARRVGVSISAISKIIKRADQYTNRIDKVISLKNYCSKKAKDKMSTDHSILRAIGNTSMVRLSNVVAPGCGQVFAKLEWENPTGSMKDRYVDGRFRSKIPSHRCLLKIAYLIN